jgi:hypothetical protein
VKISITIILSLLLLGFAFAQSSKPYFFASKHCRDSVTLNLVAHIEATVLLPLNQDSYTKWTSAFWAMEIMLYKPAGLQQKIPQLLQVISSTPANFQRAFFEMLYTLYPKEFGKKVEGIWFNLAEDKIKSMALEYMAQAAIFPAIKNDNSFYLSEYYSFYINRWKQAEVPQPSKNAFLQPDFLPGQNVLVSFQSTNRDKPGYLMFRTAEGKWLKDVKGKVFKFTQLARSISNLPFYLTNGNTPQGLYKIVGFDTSNNNWIGPTTNLQLVMPFENGTEFFFGKDTSFNNLYKKLLGNLAKYTSLWQSYQAGKIGRSEIIAHGTTIDPQYYIHQKYFPCTPSLGCLCSPETWNSNGERIFSAQFDWIKVLQTLKTLPVYLVVAEVKDL